MAVAALCGAASSFFGPAAGGVVVETVPGELRYQANALPKIGQNTVKVGGPVVGGALVAAIGASWVVAWDAVTFIAAALLCTRLALAPARAKMRTGFVHDLPEGWTDFSSRRWLWVMVLQGSVVVPAWLVGYQMLGPVYGERYLGGAAAWGLVVSFFTGGLILGAATALVWKPARVGVVVCLGTGTTALPLVTMALNLPLLVLGAATCAASTGLSLSMTVWAGLIQERIPKETLSRTLSYSTLGQNLPVPLAYLAAGPVRGAFGVRATLAATAAVIIAAMQLPLLLPQVRALTLTPAEPVDAALAGNLIRPGHAACWYS
ncbi:MFS transporter [Streptomyces sp. NPDC005407]|uniref:MFS transporter n=1 Tax=Streptomyces sp. NPDC005407 TaxID=3155340 RepID=UPI0033B194EA